MKTRLCGWGGCSALTTGSYYCPKHQAMYERKRKASAFKSATRYADYSNPEWRRLSHDVMKQKGCCEHCGSTNFLQVHHIIPVRYAPELFLDKSNMMVLCRACHQAETQREIMQRRKR